MSPRIWKRVHGELVGFGNGHRVVVYETFGLPDMGVTPIWSVLVYKGDKRVTKHITTSEPAAKRWAENNYLKGK